ncbi:MAG: HEAT repeat domain-containing protein, partial [Deltaproteobacteria bacterium]|nr:HEAT repeat domain-containing protein [Deltaproteobacteria bacterium]
DEVEAINRRIVDESTPPFRLKTLETLIEVLLMERSHRDFEEIISTILGILDASLRAGDFHGAVRVLKKFYRCLHVAGFDETQKRQIRKAIFEAGNESRVHAVHEGVKSSEEQDFDGLAEYIALLQRNAVPHLCRLLGELEGSKPRRIVSDALAELGKTSVSVFGAFLDDHRWYLARNMVYILGRIGKRECFPYLEKALDHPDPRVRREAVQAIPAVTSKEEAIAHLTRKLDDPDSKIRSIACLQLARVGKKEALRPLLDRVVSKAFRKRETREARLFLQALGLVGSDEAVPVLLRILMKKTYLGRIRGDEIRRSAADALGAIGTDKAVAALQRSTVTGDEVAREASLAVLNRISR